MNSCFELSFIVQQIQFQLKEAIEDIDLEAQTSIMKIREENLNSLQSLQNSYRTIKDRLNLLETTIQKHSENRLEPIPLEIIVYILNFLQNPKDIAHFSMVSKRYYTLVMDSPSYTDKIWKQTCMNWIKKKGLDRFSIEDAIKDVYLSSNRSWNWLASCMSHSASKFKKRGDLMKKNQSQYKILEHSWQLAERKSSSSTTTVLKFGNLNDDNPDAWLVQLYINGSRYLGYHLNGSKNGIGTFVDIKGDRYDGEWRSGKRDGEGILVCGNGITYEGQWKMGKKDGDGKVVTPNGSIYEGRWKGDRKCGLGKLVYSDGSVYIGEFRDDKRHGKGKMVWIDNAVYEGEWEKDIQTGRGTAIYPDGAKYIGEWKNNKLDGRGDYTSANRVHYKGFFKKGKGHGRGELTWSTGFKYVGEFEKGIPKDKDKAVHQRIKDLIQQQRCTGTVEQIDHGQFYFVCQSCNKEEHLYCSACKEICHARDTSITTDEHIWKEDWCLTNFFCYCFKHPEFCKANELTKRQKVDS